MPGAELGFAAPESVADALGELSEEGSIAVGGGTSIGILLKTGMLDAQRLVYLGRVPGLSDVTERAASAASSEPGERAAGEVSLGATLTLHQLCRSPLVRSRFPALVTAAEQVGNPRVRAVATLGGAVAHADPRQDLPPVLLALGARVAVVGPGGPRDLPLDGFLHGFMETDLAEDELITEIVLPVAPGVRTCYHRFNPGSADDFPAVSVAAAVSRAPDGRVGSARIALGGVGSTALLAEAAADLLIGQPLDAGTIAAAAEAAAAATAPWDDRLGSASYKQHMAQVWTRRALEACAA